MKIAIIGAAGCGKTTLFNALTGLDVQPGGARKTHLAVVKVPDHRVDKLSEMIGALKIVNAEIAFSDIAGGLGKPSPDHGMDAQLLNLMRAEEAFVMVVADFEEYIHAGGSGSGPLAYARELESDLLLADQVTLENKLERMAREHNQSLEHDALKKCLSHIEKEQPLRTLDLNKDELKAIASYSFLTLKKGVLIRNIGEERVGKPEPDGIESFAREHNLRYMSVAGKLQMEIAQMPAQDREDFAKAMGLDGYALDAFIKEAFAALNLICFFSVGGNQKEVHAWTTTRGSSAFESAGRIHSDIQRGFIRAEIITFEDYVALGGETGAKQAGKMRLEGKDYIVQDGDITLFRFNI